MSQKISNRMADTFISNGIIKEEDKEIYAYGWRALGMWLICTTTMFVVGSLMGEFLYTVLFFISFSLIRAFYDGYHANSRVFCFISSNLLFIGSILFKKYIIVFTEASILYAVIGILYFTANILYVYEYTKKLKEGTVKRYEKKKFINGIFVMTISVLIFVAMLNKSFEIGYIAIFNAFVFTVLLFCIKRLISMFQRA